MELLLKCKRYGISTGFNAFALIHVFQVVTRQVVHVHKSVSMVNGVVKNTSARAIVEYQGPQGGYRVKIEDADAAPEADSETEEDVDDEGDRASIAPSEFSDTDSVIALRRRRSSAGKKAHAITAVGDLVPTLQTSPKRKAEKAWYAAQELVESERRYVEKLRLLDQVCSFANCALGSLTAVDLVSANFSLEHP